jgi:hypothetical protein
MDEVVVDGGLTEGDDLTEAVDGFSGVRGTFTDGTDCSETSDGSGLTVVAREASERRDSVDGRRAGYVSTEVVSKSDDRELDIVLARELASSASLERFAGWIRRGKSFSGGGGGFSLDLDVKSGISGMLSAAGIGILGACGGDFGGSD